MPSMPATRPRSPRPRTSSRAANGGPAGSGRNAPRGRSNSPRMCKAYGETRDSEPPMPGPDGTITQAEQVTLVKGRIRYNRAQVRDRATELFQALHVLRTLDADAHDAIVADLDPFERRVLDLFEKPGA